jgi:hypothetical protein
MTPGRLIWLFGLVALVAALLIFGQGCTSFFATTYIHPAKYGEYLTLVECQKAQFNSPELCHEVVREAPNPALLHLIFTLMFPPFVIWP